MTKNVLYTVNAQYIDLLLASALSLSRNSQFKNLKLHIITLDFTKDDYKRVEQFLNNLNIEVFFYPLENFNISKYDLPNWRNSQISNSRLFFQDIMQKKLADIPNLLYLDADTIVTSDLTTLDSYDSKTVGAVVDYGTWKNSHRLNLPQYYNSGVLNINVDKWLANNCQEKIISTIHNNHHELHFPDQDIFNCALNKEISSLPLSYNINNYAYFFEGLLGYLYFNKKNRQVSYQEVLAAKKNPHILHAYGFSSLKPWSNNTSNPFNEIFMSYILEVNELFTKDELNTLQKLLDKYPHLLKSLILLKSYCPEFVEKEITNVLKQVNNKVKVKK